MDRSDKKKSPEQRAVDRSRRKFLVNTGYALGGIVVGGALGTLIGRKPAAKPAPANPREAGQAAPANYNRALMFFNQEQFRIVESATERIFPEDENNPGAKSLGVAFFIDHQLAGEWGFNGRDYMSPPFYTGEKEQGYQGRLKRREIFEIGLREMDNFSMTRYEKSFVELTGEQQDEVLKAFESDEVKLTTISAGGFFKMLRSGTLEGAYSDPLYGGNLDMNGWRMRGYPGNQMSFTAIIDKEFTEIEPASLQDHLVSH
ncbi:gluconate 2-dehydrogenase subunit 3 family protein [Paenibacillus arenilitoris]|uniref:Gluconate 2-dehydrogenase subunit 3 family protein n=1 Tax=Paenibacillus arenilitoris TaxID=2772299 RepID=A0A927H8H9_9BACL|nr:gluconate 2-dehydrogenase subunit 3 family protein [Paenibacillus arenilitoris]MBD2870634.1 gluconate 2-dehydrogenase subunit 3 family protein [Paenibacillus arenilitoris]